MADFLTKAKVGSWISGQEVWQTPFGNMLLFVCQLIKNRIPLKHLISKKIRFFPAKIPTRVSRKDVFIQTATALGVGSGVTEGRSRVVTDSGRDKPVFSSRICL